MSSESIGSGGQTADRPRIFHHLHVIFYFVRGLQLGLGQTRDRAEVFLAAIQSIDLHSRHRVQRRKSLGRIGKRVFHAVKTGPDIFADEQLLLIARINVASDINVRRHLRIAPA